MPFQPGQSGNPKGRPRGARNKLGEDFIAALVTDWHENGPEVIAKVRQDHPAEYLKIIVRLLPQQLEVDQYVPADQATDERLLECIQNIADDPELGPAVATIFFERYGEKAQPN